MNKRLGSAKSPWVGTDHARQTRSTMRMDPPFTISDRIRSDRTASLSSRCRVCHRHSSAEPWLAPSEASRELGPGAGAVRAISRAGFALPLRASGWAVAVLAPERVRAAKSERVLTAIHIRGPTYPVAASTYYGIKDP